MEVRQTNPPAEHHGSLTLAQALGEAGNKKDTDKSTGDSMAEKAIAGGSCNSADTKAAHALTEDQAKDQDRLEKAGVLPSLTLSDKGSSVVSGKCPVNENSAAGRAQAAAQGDNSDPASQPGKGASLEAAAGAAAGTAAGALAERLSQGIGAAAGALAGEAHGGDTISRAGEAHGGDTISRAAEAHGGDTISRAAEALKKGAEGPQLDNKGDLKKLGAAGSSVEGQLTAAPCPQPPPISDAEKASAAKTPASPTP